VDYWEYKPRKAKKCSRLAKRIEYISVREESGVTLCRSYLGVDATEVLDPTLLLTADDYRAVCASTAKSEERYIAAYILDPTPEKIALIEREAKQRGVVAQIFGADKEADLSVEEWLAMFRDAEYVITDSFHGCVFSTIFRREFAVIINRNRGASRFVSLLGKFNLLDRTIIDVEQAKVPTDPIQWQKVEQGLQSWQERSLNFLKQALCH
jgi:exopolysaccharide biosynthesis predicted pyruvyltransferase EpsI